MISGYNEYSNQMQREYGQRLEEMKTEGREEPAEAETQGQLTEIQEAPDGGVSTTVVAAIMNQLMRLRAADPGAETA